MFIILIYVTKYLNDPQADSGGPLTQNQILVGVASWSIGGCANGTVDGWDRVEFHRFWIAKMAQ
jgi:secreted trypsin-like serine protease